MRVIASEKGFDGEIRQKLGSVDRCVDGTENNTVSCGGDLRDDCPSELAVKLHGKTIACQSGEEVEKKLKKSARPAESVGSDGLIQYFHITMIESQKKHVQPFTKENILKVIECNWTFPNER